MGRGGSSARGGGGGVVFRGNGDLGSDGTITDKQKAYAQSLFGDFDSPDDLSEYRAMRISEDAAKAGFGYNTTIGVRMPSGGVKEKAGRAIYEAAYRWHKGVDITKMSKSGASVFIDGLKRAAW